MMVMDKLEYSEKLFILIGGGSYSKIKKRSNSKTQENLQQVLSKKKDDFTVNEYRELLHHCSKLLDMYNLHKIHKDDIPFRLIVSCQGQVCH